MNKIFLVLSVYLMPQIASAFPLTQLLEANGFLKDNAPQNTESCTDFTGNWKGTCTVEGKEPVEHSQKIVQVGCHQLRVNDEVSVIGGLQTGSWSLPYPENQGVLYSFQYANAWSQKRDAIGGTVSLLLKGWNKPGQVNISGNLKMTKEDGKLVQVFDGFGMKLSCVYEAQ